VTSELRHARSADHAEGDEPRAAVRGAPAVLLYRQALSARQRAALAFYSATELPLVVALTTLAVEAGHMKSSTAAGLVGAATPCYPPVGMALLDRTARPAPV
jgi:hypothetical protein